MNKPKIVPNFMLGSCIAMIFLGLIYSYFEIKELA